MNEKIDNETIVTSKGMEADGKCVCVQKGIYRKEVKKAIYKFKCGKACIVGE